MFDPKMLSVEFRNGITDENPIEGRKYTLTHKDDTGELFLTVALAYAYDKINSSARDEVFGVWKRVNNRFILKIYLYVDGKVGKEEAIKRDSIFRKELPLALSTIAYGDRKFLENNYDLLNSKIIVRFISAYEELNKIENYGTLKYYSNNRIENVQNNNNNIYMEESILNDNDPLVNNFIITLLNPYIKDEITKIYNSDMYYCLKDVEVLEVFKAKSDNKCEFNYKIYVGLKVGTVQLAYNNLIIEFLVTPNSVKTISVKNPR
ncbi:staygreen family protein [Clostridium sp.]|uniref:staygreen family protein n=1 Tax=Clostridium sp. TaxID=1506 RepID=UPI00262E60DF